MDWFLFSIATETHTDYRLARNASDRHGSADSWVLGVLVARVKRGNCGMVETIRAVRRFHPDLRDIAVAARLWRECSEAF